MNGVHTSASSDLLEGILRKEWGYEGLIMTDWFVQSDILSEIKNGGNVKMPYNDQGNYPLLNALISGEINRKKLEQACIYILNILAKLFIVDNLF